MTPRSPWMLLLMAWVGGCHCTNDGFAETSSDATSSISSETLAGSSASSGDTSAPLDASRWIGRYHFENPFQSFGERGESRGSPLLINFEVLPDFTATMFYDHCTFEKGITTVYAWAPSEDGWLSLLPGPGDTSLRIWAVPHAEAIRVQMIGPCRELRFEIDGRLVDGARFYPGESCWVDRCSAPNVMHVDYCEGEVPPPCSG